MGPILLIGAPIMPRPPERSSGQR